MYFYASLFAAFVITMLVVSKIAKMLLAKRFSFPWVLVASLVGGIAAVAAYVALSTFVKGIDPMVMLIASLSTMFVVSSAAFKYINEMSWTSAITTNIANIAVILITMTAAVVLNGKSLEEEFASLNSKANDKMSIVESAASTYQNGAVDESSLEVIGEESLAMDGEEMLDGAEMQPEASLDDEFVDEEPQITERDLLSPSAAKALKKKESVVYIEPKYRAIGVGSIGSLVGQTIRILKSNGNTISGAVKSVRGSDVYVAQRISNGIATTPVAIAKIRKLEVYR
jgi:hypothetical protein